MPALDDEGRLRIVITAMHGDAELEREELTATEAMLFFSFMHEQLRRLGARVYPSAGKAGT